MHLRRDSRGEVEEGEKLSKPRLKNKKYKLYSEVRAAVGQAPVHSIHSAAVSASLDRTLSRDT
jgi:hypothetical protein